LEVKEKKGRTGERRGRGMRISSQRVWLKTRKVDCQKLGPASYEPVGVPPWYYLWTRGAVKVHGRKYKEL